MRTLYITADKIGTWTGGGKVTQQEMAALLDFTEQHKGQFAVWDRDILEKNDSFTFGQTLLGEDEEEPWVCDNLARNKQDFFVTCPSLAHFYAGTFGKTVNSLKRSGCKVVYTIAAHDREISKREHERLGLQFAYPHLVVPELWRRYIEGYRRADVIVCPSTVAANTVRNYGEEFASKNIVVIPHGVSLPSKPIQPPPSRLTVGYLGAVGPDKGLRYLMEAWKKLNYADAELVIAGKESLSPFCFHLLNEFGGGAIRLMGWVDDTRDFYNSISLYVQPSATEGYGIEVLEAYAHDRPVICSWGAGAVDAVPNQLRVPACNSDAIASKIDDYKRGAIGSVDHLSIAAEHTWGKIRKRYQDLWSTLV